MPRSYYGLPPRRRRLILLFGSLLTLLLAALAGLAVVSGIATPLLVQVGLAAPHRPGPDSYTTPVQINGKLVFPTPTIPAWSPRATPTAAAIASSRTPVPGAAPTATPTAASSSAATPGDGGGGAQPTACNGSSHGGAWAFSTCPLVHGQPVTLTLSAPSYPRASTNILLNFGSCAGCTRLLTPAQGYHLDATGREAVTVTVPAGAANGTAPVSGMVNIAGGPALSLSAPPVR